MTNSPSGNNTETTGRHPKLAIAIVISELLVWLIISVYFFNSRYSEVSYLFPFVLGFPLFSLALHLLGFVLFSVFASPQKKRAAKYSFVMIFVLWVFSYAMLIWYMLSQPNK